jgi:hypothetical protein
MGTAPSQHSITDIAWAAGLFEGEGSIFINNNNGRKYVLLNLSSTDRDVVEKFTAIMGCGKMYGPYVDKNPARPRYSWHTKSRADSVKAIVLLEPFLCERRLAKLNACRAEATAQKRPMEASERVLSTEARAKMGQSAAKRWARVRKLREAEGVPVAPKSAFGI